MARNATQFAAQACAALEALLSAVAAVGEERTVNLDYARNYASQSMAAAHNAGEREIGQGLADLIAGVEPR